MITKILGKDEVPYYNEVVALTGGEESRRTNARIFGCGLLDYGC